MITFAVLTGIGAIFSGPRRPWPSFGGLLGGDTRTASPLYVGNQSLLGVFFRLFGDGPARGPWPGCAIGGLVALIGR